MAGKTLTDAIAFNNANATPKCRSSSRRSSSSPTVWPWDPTIRKPDFGGMTYNQALEIDRLVGR